LNDKPRILLVNPLVGDDYEFTRENRPLPLGLLSACSLLTGEFDVRVLDERMENPDPFLSSGQLRGGLCVGIHVMGGPQILTALDVSRRIKASADVPVVWGGVFPTLRTREVLSDPAVDYVVRGEGEHTFLDLARALRSGAPVEGIAGVACRRDGGVFVNADRPFLDMNTLPPLPYHLLDLGRYSWSASVNVSPDLKLQVETSRGCSSRCIYCYNPFYYRKSWRAMNPENTVDRFERLVRGHGCGFVDVIDDSYFEDLPRVVNVAELILRRGLRMRYLINGGKVKPILKMSDGDLDLLRRSGNRIIHLGAESGSDAVLETLRKGITAAEILESNRKLGRAGIHASYYFLFGAPGETDADRKRSLDLMLRLIRENPDTKIIAAFSFTPFAETESYGIARARGMPEPGSLEAYSRYDTLNTLQPWLGERERRQVRFLFFLTIFIDGKVRDLSPSPLVRWAAALYRPLARLRVSRMWLGAPVEMWVGRFLLGILQRGARRRALERRPPFAA